MLVKDIYPGTGSSFPENFTNINGILYFTAKDVNNEFALWKSDGTVAGTMVVQNFQSASYLPSPITISGNNLFLIAPENGVLQLFAATISAPPSADHFRTKVSGNWNDINTWESSPDNINWYPATLTPDFNANTITILNGHTVTVTANVTIDQTTINPGGSVIVNSGVILTVK